MSFFAKKAKVFVELTDIYNSMANNTKHNKHNKGGNMQVKIYVDGTFFGWGTLDKVNSYRANGWTVVLDV